MAEELRLWTVGKSGDVEPLEKVEQMETELEFEDLLVQRPEMLEPGLKLVGRQTPTQTGWLDILAVDRDGRLVVFELKRGKPAREAVTQVLDYASDLNAMNISDLAGHICEHSGSDGIQRIDDFEEWYANNFAGASLSGLLPPRMVLVGLAVDPVAERMARFISGGPVDLSVMTFQGFKRGIDRLLARQIDEPSSLKNLGTRRHSQVLREHLQREGYEDMFDRICAAIRKCFPKQYLQEEELGYGMNFRLRVPFGPNNRMVYFGVYAGYNAQDVYSITIPSGAKYWGNEALEKLNKSVILGKWSHGKDCSCVDFKSAEDWEIQGPAVLDFVRTVIANRSIEPEEGN